MIFALSGAIGPIIGQNAGAGDTARVRAAFRDALIFTGIVVVLVTTILFLLRDPIVELFAATGVARDLVFLFCGPLALAFFFNGALFVSNASFNNLGHPFLSTWSNWGRHTLGTIPFVMVFAAWLGAPGVLIGQALGGVLFGLLSVVMALRVMARAEGTPPREPYFRGSRLFQVLNHRR